MASEMLTSGASGRVSALISMSAWRSFMRMMMTVLFVILGPFRERRQKVAPISVSAKEEKVVSGCVGGGPVVRLPAAIVRRVVADQEVAARRMIAIRRVKEDEDDKCLRDYSLFGTPRGVTLFTQSWSPVYRNVRGLVLLLHGLNEHSGRYSDFAKQLNGIGIKVYGMDWIGHGGSDGLHAYVPSLDDAVVDMKAFLDTILSENPGLPCFCFAHSTGAAIVLKAALDPKVEAQIHGIVLTSPAVGVSPSHPIFSVIAPIASFLFPRYQCRAANKSGTVVCRDPEALIAKYSDPLVYTSAIRVRTGCEILRISAYIQENLKRLRVSFLVLHGSADAVTDPEGSKKLYEEASSTDKAIKLYDGLLHDILFEPERQTVIRDITEWLIQRIED
ncbi:uncharacterized protein [Spinacia oleracea]|uniref:Serine aminopeptidase S33 domain-containing protein n=1 Tax=Spinacia oleracea TaxID=3562 RepID=A0A9R0ISH5_SPIOL|nr:uncharacterized protein LOC110794146 [Spinacia oleracea]